MRAAARWIRRLPLRVRLVAGFSATMAVVLLAAGSFVYWRVDFALDRQLNEELTEVADRLVPLVDGRGQLVAGAAPADRSEIYQVLDAQGQVLTASPTAGLTPLLGLRDAREAQQAPVRRDLGALLPIKNHPLRAYALPLDRPGEATVLVVGVRRDHRDEALLELLVQLSVAGLGALAVTSTVGYLLARSTLAPVEAYRLRAAQVIGGATGVRLVVPDQRPDEITRLGQTLNMMLDALEAALERERDFVRDASHELRTPLTLLSIRLQLALSRPRTVEEHQETLREIRVDLDQLIRLSERLLEPTTTHPADSDGADMTAVVTDRVTRRQLSIQHPSDLLLEPPPAGLRVALDVTTLGQVVDNLLTNSVLHGQPPVVIRTDQVDGWGRLQVSDAGAGMEADLLAVATRRFSRSPSSRDKPGHGLGLHLVEQAVARVGGELRLCYAGHHQLWGHPTNVACQHQDAMTVTVLLPTQDETMSSSARPPLGSR